MASSSGSRHLVISSSTLRYNARLFQTNELENMGCYIVTSQSRTFPIPLICFEDGSPQLSELVLPEILNPVIRNSHYLLFNAPLSHNALFRYRASNWDRKVHKRFIHSYLVTIMRDCSWKITIITLTISVLSGSKVTLNSYTHRSLQAIWTCVIFRGQKWNLNNQSM